MATEAIRVRRVRPFRVAVVARAALVVAAFAASVAILKSASTPRVASAKLAFENYPLAITPDPIVLDVPRHVTAFSVRNVRSEPITIGRVETSCPCLDIGPLPARVGAGETKSLWATFQPSPDDVDWKGRLSVEITGYSTGSTAVFRTHAQIDLGALIGGTRD